MATRSSRAAPEPRPAVPAPRRKPLRDPDYRTLIMTSIHDIDATRWDALVGTSAVTRSHAYLAAIEAAQIHDYRFFYPVVFNRHNETVAHACVYTASTDFAQLMPRPLAWMAARIQRVWPRFLTFRITECALPLVVGSSISVRDGEDRGRLLIRIAEAAADIARTERSSLVVMRDFLDAERAQADVLLDHGFNLTANMPLARIRIRWKSYAEYLADMRARYRKDIKRRLAVAARDSQVVQVLEHFGADAARWARQAAVVAAKTKGFKREALTPEYYVHMDAKLGAHSRLLVIDRRGVKVAHGMIILDDANTIATYFGREPGLPGKEWFTLINEVIRIGIERQSRYIHLGLGSYTAKTLVGAEIEALHVYCRSTFEPINWLMRLVPRAIGHQTPTVKQIFRDDA